MEDEKSQARRTPAPEEERYHTDMARLYRQHVLREDPSVVPLGSLRSSTRQARQEKAPAPAGAPRT